MPASISSFMETMSNRVKRSWKVTRRRTQPTYFDVDIHGLAVCLVLLALEDVLESEKQRRLVPLL